MRFTKSILTTLAASMLAMAALPAQASFITRAQFDADSVNYGFENAAVGALSPTDGFLTVSGAHVSATAPAGQQGRTYTNDGGYGTVNGATIRLSFASTVNAVGFNAYYNNAPVLFQVFSAQNALLDSVLMRPTDCGSICGFMGLRANGISYALLSVPSVNGHNLYADNIVYDKVPEPASLALFGLGMLALGLRRRMTK